MICTNVGINNSNPLFTLDVNGDSQVTDNLIVQGMMEVPILQIENIAVWTGTVHFEDNVWKVDTIYESRISPSSITLVSTGVFRISFTGATLPTKEVDSGTTTSIGSRRYFVSGMANQGSLITDRNAAWPSNSVEYSCRTFLNTAANGATRIYVKILLDS